MAWGSHSCFSRSLFLTRSCFQRQFGGLALPYYSISDRCRKEASGEKVLWKVVSNTVQLLPLLQRRSVFSIPHLTGVYDRTGGTKRLEIETKIFLIKKVLTFNLLFMGT